MYTALIIGAIFTVVLGVPAVVWLTKLIRPPKPEEEAIHRGVEEARRPVRTHPSRGSECSWHRLHFVCG